MGSTKVLDWKQYEQIAAKAIAEGIVMLRNEGETLPLREGTRVSVFGRIQSHYYKSGTGSGGMVNTDKIINVVDGLAATGKVKLNETLKATYEAWEESHPFELGEGWGAEPWCQEEMPLTDEIVAAASASSDAAIVIIGRTAGEEQDNKNKAGSWLLTEKEEAMLSMVRRYFKRMIVLLNVGNIMDMGFVDRYQPEAVLYIWQGGMMGGMGTAMVLTGEVSPCGKLPDTIARSIEAYPSHPYFGDTERDFYCEDIYVGYRYFETFDKASVRYPFGFGLSYTTFRVTTTEVKSSEASVELTVSVTNTGTSSGKEVVQVYCEAPQGMLGKPAKVLCGFAKTKELRANESCELKLSVLLSDIASFDDSGVTGNKGCFVLESGEYRFYVGTDVATAAFAAFVSITQTTVTKKASSILTPVLPFERMHPEKAGDMYTVRMEAVPVAAPTEETRRIANLPTELPYSGNKGILLSDVAEGRHTMDEFLAQLNDDDLCCIVRGEGMGSPKVTPGTASAFGGVSKGLSDLGIPCACCSDGPSGMRLDSGAKAFSLPNGTLLASTCNTELISELFSLLGLEMAANHVECLLGPGMNIHRHPLNGRNFEYFSEDPYLTGTIAAAELTGLHRQGVTGTIKHFCGNNQETGRHFIDSVISERALREIYLKGFEIAVKSGHAASIMTTYGRLNGLYTAANYDLTTALLRDEWGFEGVAMTDWWANINRREQDAPDKSDLAAMVRAQNDLYMVCANGDNHEDNLASSLADGSLTRAELQRCARNVCTFLLSTQALKRLSGSGDSIEITGRENAGSSSAADSLEMHSFDSKLVIDLTDISTERGSDHAISLEVLTPGRYEVTITASSTMGELAQMPVTLFSMGTACGTYTWNGTNGEEKAITKSINFFSRYTAIRLYFAQSGLKLHKIEFKLVPWT